MPAELEGADLRAALVAICLRGALPPVDLRAVCLVRAMSVPSYRVYDARPSRPGCLLYTSLGGKDPGRTPPLIGSRQVLEGKRAQFRRTPNPKFDQGCGYKRAALRRRLIVNR